MPVPIRRVLDPIFGKPILRAANNGRANWSRANALSQWQKGSGWQANLYGGVQTGNDDWAALFIPVNEKRITDFNSARWSYYMTNAETMGVNIVIWAHSSDDFSKRAEITQLANIAGLGKASGWNSHALVKTTDQFFYYGENTTGTNLTQGVPNYYGWDDFQADPLFMNWTIYRISFEYGWDASGTFDDAWLAEVVLDGQRILFDPDDDDLVPVKQVHTATSAAIATTLAPKTPFRLIGVELKINTAGTTSESFTVTKDAGLDAAYDQLLATQNTKTPAITDLFLPFGEGYEYAAADEIDCAWPNTENRTYGLTYTWKPI